MTQINLDSVSLMLSVACTKIFPDDESISDIEMLVRGWHWCQVGAALQWSQVSVSLNCHKPTSQWQLIVLKAPRLYSDPGILLSVSQCFVITVVESWWSHGDDIMQRLWTQSTNILGSPLTSDNCHLIISKYTTNNNIRSFTLQASRSIVIIIFAFIWKAPDKSW